MNQQERIDSFIRDYQKLVGPEKIVTNETTIKGTSIDRICQYDNERPYRRMRRWLDNALKKKEIEENQKSSPNLFEKPKKERKPKKEKTIKKIQVKELTLTDVLVNFKIGRLTIEDTIFVIKEHYKQ